MALAALDAYKGMRNVQIQMYGNSDGFIRHTKWGSNISMQGFASTFLVPRTGTTRT